MRYALAAIIVSVIGSIGINLAINLELSERAAAGQREATCEIVRTQLAIYTEEPPSTPTGVAAVSAWRAAYVRYGCEN